MYNNIVDVYEVVCCSLIEFNMFVSQTYTLVVFIYIRLDDLCLYETECMRLTISAVM